MQKSFQDKDFCFYVFEIIFSEHMFIADEHLPGGTMYFHFVPYQNIFLFKLHESIINNVFIISG